MHTRWKGHMSASKRRTISDLKSTFYETYPSKSAENTPNIQSIKGNFEDLKQLIGIGFEETKMKEVTDLFHWSDKEVHYLRHLSLPNKSDSLVQRKYHCSCTETWLIHNKQR